MAFNNAQPAHIGVLGDKVKSHLRKALQHRRPLANFSAPFFWGIFAENKTKFESHGRLTSGAFNNLALAQDFTALNQLRVTFAYVKSPLRHRVLQEVRCTELENWRTFSEILYAQRSL